MSNQQAVTEMFDDISPHYDFLNHCLSFHIDKLWRRTTSQRVAQHHPRVILDVATGTADLAIRMARDIPQAKVTGIDLSERMLEKGKEKITKKKLDDRINLITSDVTQMPFENDTFDAVTVAFGVRNFANREMGLREMVRVCRPGGFLAVLEFSHPKNPLIAVPYRWYSNTILPMLGRLVSKHPTAYRYLPSSVAAFPESDTFVATLCNTGLLQVEAKELSNGIATLYYGTVNKNTSSTQ